MKKSIAFSAFTLVTIGLLPSAARGATLYGDVVDIATFQNQTTLAKGTIGPTDSLMFAGQFNNVSRAPVYAIQLPSLATLGAVTSPFATSSFTVNLQEIRTVATGHNVDLYGLAARATSTISATGADYYGDTAAVDSSSNAFLLQDDFATPDSTAGATELLTSIDITSFLNAQWGVEGANAGNWVFFRLSTDADFANNERYFFRTADGAAALGDSALAPQINYTLIAIPEPGAALLIGAATMLFGIRRKR